jgi:hypothetical protein
MKIVLMAEPLGAVLVMFSFQGHGVSTKGIVGQSSQPHRRLSTALYGFNFDLAVVRIKLQLTAGSGQDPDRFYSLGKADTMLKKIMSGGQTGADRAALDAALRLGIPHGGWVPKGRLAEDGRVPEHYLLEEMPTDSYRERTRKNVLASDGTLIISRGSPTGGTDYTRVQVLRYGKQLLSIDLNNQSNLKDAASLIASWIDLQRIEVLNVAGPRASKDPCIYQDTLNLLVFALG